VTRKPLAHALLRIGGGKAIEEVGVDVHALAGERRLLHVLKGHNAEVYAVAFTPDGQRVVTGSFDQTAKLWSVASGREIAPLTGHRDKIFALAVSPADGTIATVG
jgi:WD40 repeat protein